MTDPTQRTLDAQIRRLERSNQQRQHYLRPQWPVVVTTGGTVL